MCWAKNNDDPTLFGGELTNFVVIIEKCQNLSIVPVKEGENLN